VTGSGDGPPPLVADAMLGRLARWLRALGLDVHPDPPIADGEIARLADREGRLLLTRDRRLCEGKGSARCRLVRARRPAGQLRELAPDLGLFDSGWRGRLFTRCMVCNACLHQAPWGTVAESLPPDVRTDPRVRSAGVQRCPSCGRVYWEGSHTRRMRRWLERVAGTSDSAG
jgi:uncharacterized protein with PIN domain